MDLCPDCAFCSLKREQCQGVSNLRRVHCDAGTFATYINPEISAQYQAVGNKVPKALRQGLGVNPAGGEARPSLTIPSICRSGPWRRWDIMGWKRMEGCVQITGVAAWPCTAVMTPA